MKKEYIKPELMVEELETIEMIAMSIEEGVAGEGDQLSTGRNNRRGTWGNLWYTEQE